jgi:hypothetical protein
MDNRPDGQSKSGQDTLPEFPAVVDEADDDNARTARRVRRHNAIRQTLEASAEIAKDAPEMVLEFVFGILP